MEENNAVNLDDLTKMKAQTESMIQTLRVFIPKVENTVEFGNLYKKDTKDINAFCKDLLKCLMSLNTKLAETTEKVNKLETITSESNTTPQLRETRGRFLVDSGCYSVPSEIIQNEMDQVNDGATEHSMGTLLCAVNENASVSEDISGDATSTDTLTTQNNTTLADSQTQNDNVLHLDNLNTLNVSGYSLTVSSVETSTSINTDTASVMETHAENENSGPTEKHLVKENLSQSEASSDTDEHSSVVLKTETANTSGDKHLGNTEPFSKPELTFNVTEETKDESDDNVRTEEQDTNC